MFCVLAKDFLHENYGALYKLFIWPDKTSKFLRNVTFKADCDAHVIFEVRLQSLGKGHS